MRWSAAQFEAWLERRRGFAAAALLVVALVGIAYVPVLGAGLLWDDHLLIETGAARHFDALRLLLGPFWPDGPLSDGHVPYYRPLTLISFRANLIMSGESVADEALALHRTNLLLHLLNVILLARVARKLGASSVGGLLAALVWGLLPRLTEAVAWIAGRTDVLAGSFGLAAILACPYAARDLEPSRRRRILFAITSGLFLFGSLLSKEIGAAFAVALAPGYLRRGREIVSATAGFVLPVAAYLTLRGIALPEGATTTRERALGTVQRIGLVFETLGRYVEMTVDAFRARTVIGIVGEVDVARAAVGLVATVAVAVLVWRHRNAARGSIVAIVLTLTSLLAVAQVFPLALGGGVAADRLLYVPLAGLVLVAAVGVTASDRLRWRRLVAGLALALAAAGFVSTRARVGDYTDELRFWIEAARSAPPGSAMPRSALAGIVRDRGEPVLACALYGRAFRYLEARQARSPMAHRRTGENLVGCWARIGRYEPAHELAERLALQYPTSSRVQMALGFARLHLLQFDGATAALLRAKADPRLLAFVEPALTAISEIDPVLPKLADDPEVSDLSRARYYLRVGRAIEAEEAWLVVVGQPAAPVDVRQEGIVFLVGEGSLPAARHAVATWRPPPALSDTVTKRLAAREARYASLVPHLARIRELGE